MWSTPYGSCLWREQDETEAELYHSGQAAATQDGCRSVPVLPSGFCVASSGSSCTTQPGSPPQNKRSPSLDEGPVSRSQSKALLCPVSYNLPIHMSLISCASLQTPIQGQSHAVKEWQGATSSRPLGWKALITHSKPQEGNSKLLGWMWKADTVFTPHISWEDVLKLQSSQWREKL